ncbi:MAG: hypothetical protein AYP45_04835 [Candidatus Brocadia carolinensis]|uniref:Uncharacterized protein n=1 Tax=Candidatus Brocadia carolinensis TaxID=1004156 RepID=A0A1V4AVR5_9BACT|nr:MAG: hypothetical protein AYP45_04835 [Candidatus Brocadia caroliniensis]
MRKPETFSTPGQSNQINGLHITYDLKKRYFVYPLTIFAILCQVFLVNFQDNVKVLMSQEEGVRRREKNAFEWGWKRFDQSDRKRVRKSRYGRRRFRAR